MKRDYVQQKLTLVNLRTEIEKSYQDKIDKLNVEKDIIENKINQKKKEIRDIQTSNLKATSSLEKEKAILLEKISNLEKINKEINLNSGRRSIINENNHEKNFRLSLIQKNLVKKTAIKDSKNFGIVSRDFKRI